jgi:hypothetical protein
LRRPVSLRFETKFGIPWDKMGVNGTGIAHRPPNRLPSKALLNLRICCQRAGNSRFPALLARIRAIFRRFAGTGLRFLSWLNRAALTVHPTRNRHFRRLKC